MVAPTNCGLMIADSHEIYIFIYQLVPPYMWGGQGAKMVCQISGLSRVAREQLPHPHYIPGYLPKMVGQFSCLDQCAH